MKSETRKDKTMLKLTTLRPRPTLILLAILVVIGVIYWATQCSKPVVTPTPFNVPIETPTLAPKPEPTIVPTPAPVVAPVEKRVVISVAEQNGTYTVKISKSAIAKNLKVRLNIGYMVYEGKAVGNTVTIKPEWNPQGRVTVGIWNASTERYVSSVFVKNVKANLPIQKVTKVTHIHTAQCMYTPPSIPDPHAGQSADDLNEVWQFGTEDI